MESYLLTENKQAERERYYGQVLIAMSQYLD